MKKTGINWKILAISALLIAGCHQYDNFTTYFNTFYNAERILFETEDEFSYKREDKREWPRVVVPDSLLIFKDKFVTGPPEFLDEFIIPKKWLQPVKVKLDSIIIKGSKILANHPNSDYIEGTLYLMAKSFFYQNEWLSSETKCLEMLDTYPDGDWSPDGHLLLAENQLIQRKFRMGRKTLSRTVDIAWQLKRYDILSEAFRLEAELSLYQNDLDGALRPYLQAVAQTDDGMMKAQWQTDMAMLLYRMSRYKDAAEQFALVHKYSPNYIPEFEAYLYRAISLAHLGEFEEAEDILDALDSDGNNDEWKDYIMAGRMQVLMMQGKLIESGPVEKHVDSTFMSKPIIHAVYFERGMELFNTYDYTGAKRYFARIRSMRTDYRSTSKKMYQLLDDWYNLRSKAFPVLQKINDGEPVNDSAKIILAFDLFKLGRVHDQMNNQDSAFYYYKTAASISPREDTNSAKYIYVYARTIEDDDMLMADSLYDYIVKRYPYTVYAKDASLRQGYDEDYLVHPAQRLYIKGYREKQDTNYAGAIATFFRIFKKFPDTDYAPRSLYAIGWTFEKDLKNLDSALYYYQLLIKTYPMSEYARDLNTSIDFLLAIKSGGPLPDSLKPKSKVSDRKPIEFKMPTQVQPGNKTPGNKSKMDAMDLINNPGAILNNVSPSKLIDDTKKKITDPNLLKPKLQLPKNPIENIEKKEKDTTSNSGKG